MTYVDPTIKVVERRTGSYIPHGGLLNFHRKIEVTDGCWNWKGSTSKRGYPLYVKPGHNVGAHRFAYELVMGDIPDGLELDHTCRNTHCVRPDHLEPVTSQVNTLRGTSPASMNAAKTHCMRGHPLSGGNLYTAPSGGRKCRICTYATNRAYRSRRRQAA